MLKYMVEYEEKTSLFFKDNPGDNFLGKLRAVVTLQMLPEMLSSWKYMVYSAKLVGNGHEVTK